jgi:outer membrane protein TolC
MWAEVEHQFMLGVSANIPLQRASRHGAADEANAELSASQHALARRIDDIRVEVEQARLRLVEAQHVVMLYNERLLPAGRDQARVALPAFQTGQSSFIEVVSAQKNLLVTELGRHMAVAEMYRRMARLDRAVGRLPGSARGQTGTSP